MAKAPVQTSRGEARAHATAAAPVAQRDASSDESRTAESRLVIRGPVSGRMLRSFTLPDSNGRAVSLWSYRQRTNLVLFFHHGSHCPACHAMLRELAANAAAYREEEALILGIGPDEPTVARRLAATVDCPFPLLSDPANQTVAEQGLDVPAMVVADRFGEIWAAWAGGDEHTLPGGREIARWLEFVELQCPECGVAEWPPSPSDVIME